MSINIEVEGGKSVRLKTAGKYCDRDIVVTAKGGASGDNKLAQIIDRSVTEITADDLAGVTKIGNNAFQSCNKLVRAELPYTATIIGNGAFQDCTILENLPITNGVKEIGNNAFNNCQKITRIVIPDTVTSLKSSAFQYCIKADTVIIGSGVKKIDSYAFADCRVLKSVTIKAETPPTISSSSFRSVPDDCAFYVPPSSVDLYKAATNWSARADYIFPIVAEKGEVYTQLNLDEVGHWFGISTPIPLIAGEKYYIESTPFVATSGGDVGYVAPPSGALFTGTDGNEYYVAYDPTEWGIIPNGDSTEYLTVTIYNVKE